MTEVAARPDTVVGDAVQLAGELKEPVAVRAHQVRHSDESGLGGGEILDRMIIDAGHHPDDAAARPTTPSQRLHVHELERAPKWGAPFTRRMDVVMDRSSVIAFLRGGVP